MLNRRSFTRFIIIALIALLSLGLSACQEDNGTPSVTTTPTTVPSTTAAPDLFLYDDLKGIWSEAGKILETGNYVIENPNHIISYFFRVNSRLNHFSVITEDRITLSYDPSKVYETKNTLQFALFLDLICTRYPDAYYATKTHDFEPSGVYNLSFIFFAPDYAVYGYASPAELHQALKNNEIDVQGHFFDIYYGNELWIKMWNTFNGQNGSYTVLDYSK